jgi:hypothetical protein
MTSRVDPVRFFQVFIKLVRCIWIRIHIPAGGVSKFNSKKTLGAHGALLTPISTPVNLMVFGPGGYKFGDYWRFGLPIGSWWFVVVVTVVPLHWRF